MALLKFAEAHLRGRKKSNNKKVIILIIISRIIIIPTVCIVYCTPIEKSQPFPFLFSLNHENFHPTKSYIYINLKIYKCFIIYLMSLQHKLPLFYILSFNR